MRTKKLQTFLFFLRENGFCGNFSFYEMKIIAWNCNIAYRKTLGVSDALPPGMQDTGRPSSGGVILTASGLTFVGATDDRRFRAFETATGKNLWTVELNASAESTPISYQGSDGRQFVAITATGGGLIGAKLEGDEVVAFALPK